MVSLTIQYPTRGTCSNRTINKFEPMGDILYRPAQYIGIGSAIRIGPACFHALRVDAKSTFGSGSRLGTNGADDPIVSGIGGSSRQYSSSSLSSRGVSGWSRSAPGASTARSMRTRVSPLVGPGQKSPCVVSTEERRRPCGGGGGRGGRVVDGFCLRRPGWLICIARVRIWERLRSYSSSSSVGISLPSWSSRAEDCVSGA